VSKGRKSTESDYVQFNSGQWRKILKALGKEKIPVGYEKTLVALATVLRDFRKLPEVSLVQERGQAERISKLSAALREAIGENERHGLAYMAFDGGADFGRAQIQWRDFVVSLESVEKAARRSSQWLVGRKTPPANVDELRNITWSRLNQLYQLVTDDEPKFRIGTATSGVEGEVSGNFVEFVQAFMEAIPGEKRPSPNTVREFVRHHGKNYLKADEW
jgi:hypothetical protein